MRVSRKALALTVASVLISIALTSYSMCVSASPIVIDGDSSGSWEDAFTDTNGIETWDNLERTDEGLRFIDVFEDNFTGIDGSLPDQRKWFILDDGQILEIRNNYLRTVIDTVGSSTWGAELVRTNDDFGGKHVLTWSQNLRKPNDGAVYNFFMINASDNSRLFGFNQNWAGDYWVVSYAGGGDVNLGGPYDGWFDHKITYDNGYVEFYLSGILRYSYAFNVSSVKYEFGAFEQTCDARIFTDDILIASNITTGNVTSTKIQLPVGQSWGALTLSKYEDVPRNQIKVSILDGMTYYPIPGYEDLTVSDVDISGIDRGAHPTIRLRARFSGDGTSTPVLRSWNVTWIDNIPPSAPTGLEVVNAWTGYSLLLVWDSNIEPDLQRYSLYCSTDNTTFAWIGDVTADELSFDHIGLTAGIRYYYKMTASDEVPNESPYSEVAEGVPDTDMDSDGIGDSVDPDRDGDTVPNAEDEFPDNENEWRDTDGDGIGDNAEAGADTGADNEILPYILIALVLLAILVILVVILIIMTARSGKKGTDVPQEESLPPPPEE